MRLYFLPCLHPFWRVGFYFRQGELEYHPQITTTRLMEAQNLFSIARSEPYSMSHSSCARQRERCSIFIASESLFPIRSYRKCTPSRPLSLFRPWFLFHRFLILGLMLYLLCHILVPLSCGRRGEGAVLRL